MVLCLTAAADTDSLAPISPAADTLPAEPPDADTLADDARRDSLREQSIAFSDTYRRFPGTLDSALATRRILPHQLHAQDAFGVSRALASSPYFTYVPYALESSRNRALYLGLPTPRPYLIVPASAMVPRPTRERGDDWLFAASLERVEVAPDGSVCFTLHALPHTTPAAFFAWENGVFDENTLHVLFARPVTRLFSFGVTSDYRSLRAGTYSHTRGGVYDSYRGMVDDTSFVVKQVTNPLSREHVVGIRAQYHGALAHGELGYTYLDLHNGRVFGSDTLPLGRDTLHQYSHNVALSLSTIGNNRLAVRGSARLNHDVERERRALDTEGYYVSSRGGTLTSAGAELTASLALSGSDTLSARARGSVGAREFYHDRGQIQTGLYGDIGYARTLGDSALGASVSAGLGFQFAQVNTETRGSPSTGALVWHGVAAGWLGAQRLSLSARRDLLEYAPPLASEFVLPDQPADPVDMYGAEVSLGWRRLSLLAGYLYSTGIDSVAQVHAWPDNLPPYQEPHSVVMLAPAAGRFAGFTFHGQWLISDTRPYHKVQAGITWERLVARGNELIRLEALVNYWSEREHVEYGGTDTWHYSIFDVRGRASVQIKTFRLFFNVDNILNRTIAYVPGNVLPGLTFRWGFNWYFQR